MPIVLTTSDGIPVYDVVRMFHGDGPACQLEVGQQKGGYFYCTSCDIHAAGTTDIVSTYYAKYRSMSDRINLVMKGTFGKKHTLAKSFKPFGNLKVDELKKELNSQNLPYEGLKPDL